MIFAFCVEGVGDQEVLRTLLSRALGQEITAYETTFRFPPSGWSNALKIAPAVAVKAYQAGLDGAVFAIDNDGAEPTHTNEHQVLGGVAGCRLCRLRSAANIEAPLSWLRPELPPLRYIFAVPVQTIETWLLVGNGTHLKGAPEEHGRRGDGRREQKKLLYGTESPDSETLVNVGVRIARTLDLDDLAQKSSSFRNFLAQARNI
jgi:hypothetical protein